MSLTVAALRMKAIRFEEKERWADAADAWRQTLGAMAKLAGTVIEATRAECQARLAAAERRVGELMETAMSAPKIEEHVKPHSEGEEV